MARSVLSHQHFRGHKRAQTGGTDFMARSVLSHQHFRGHKRAQTGGAGARLT
jgi:hypothetical protein